MQPRVLQTTAIMTVISSGTIAETAIPSTEKIKEQQAVQLAQVETWVGTATREARRRMDLPEAVEAFDQSTVEGAPPITPQ